MTLLVLLIGVLIIGIGMAILISPARLRQMLHWFLERQHLYVVAGIRILAGLIFLLAAPDTRMPALIRVLGGLFILAGITLPLLGAERIDKLAGWWLARSDNALRLWALAAMAFGGLVAWAAV